MPRKNALRFTKKRRRSSWKGGFRKLNHQKKNHRTQKKFTSFVPKDLGTSIIHKIKQIDASKKGKPNPNEVDGDKMFLFFADWCPHCISMKSDWHSFDNWMKHKHPNIYVFDIESKVPNREEIQTKHGVHVDGFPTIAFVKKGGGVTYFSGNRNLTSFQEWANTLFPSTKKGHYN